MRHLDLFSGIGESALAWFNDAGNEEINSFIGICETLGIDPDKARVLILSKKRKGCDV
ncbi:hypothetical protein [Desulfobacula sp.]|uniref:hypothetical protein n=1 Tax=Desulfobacula sp. TaxID=2593537 RepID=UPI001EB45DE2|nr:hypothetical protein [Desulfobacula sp.]